jgi:hypothetical protein
VTVLAGNLVDAGVDAVAERDWLLDVAACGPRTLGEGDGAGGSQEEEERKRD